MTRETRVLCGITALCISGFLLSVVFFFSSRRRHTRLVSDWSSDVCSSDLERSGSATRPCRGARRAFWERHASLPGGSPSVLGAPRVPAGGLAWARRALRERDRKSVV